MIGSIVVLALDFGEARSEAVFKEAGELAPVDDKEVFEDQYHNDRQAEDKEDRNVCLSHPVGVEVLTVVSNPGFDDF